MQVSGQMEVVKTMMEAESPARKLSYMIQGIVWTILFATMGGIYLSYMVNANKWNDLFDLKACEASTQMKAWIALINSDGGNVSCEDFKDRVYDLMFWAGPWDDEDQLNEYGQDLEDWDAGKVALGSRFSVVYAFCGITFIMIATANLCISIGAYNLQARMLGGCCGCCFGCINFAALITTAVFRFNTMGSLAAISKTPTKYVGEGNVIASDDTTYMTDASTILALWVVQMLACVCSCCVSMFLNKPPSQEEIARAMQSQGIDGPMTHH